MTALLFVLTTHNGDNGGESNILLVQEPFGKKKKGDATLK